MLCTQTWREKQRLCDAVLPTIADQVNDSSSASVPILSDECKQMNDGAKWLLSDFTLFSMAEKTLPAMDLAKLKSCVGVRPLALLLCLCTASLHYFLSLPALRLCCGLWLCRCAALRVALRLWLCRCTE